MVGETLGSYQILSQLGAGAMGEVYLAEHRHLRRKAAVKLLSGALIGRPDLLERFFLEARATSAIEHPGIVHIFDCEIDKNGRPYIVMEYLPGETLAAYLARTGPLPGLTAARLARGIAEALEAAHAKGIVHRDLKPENVFVVGNPPESVKIVDFGIAKLAGDIQAGQIHRTRDGVLMGTPPYMSPEQCRDSAAIDYRTDLYSLGCVLFEMLTGRTPFQHSSLGDLVVAHLTEPAKDARTVNPGIPPALAELVAKLLEKDPAARPAGMREVADRLTAYEATATNPPKRADTTFRATASELLPDLPATGGGGRRGKLGIAASVALALVIGGAFLMRGRSGPTEDTRPEPSLAASAAGPAAAPAAPAPKPADAPAAASVGSATKETAQAASTVGTTRKGKDRRGAPRPVAAVTPPPPAPTGPAPAAATKPATIAGVWEGPWNDRDKNQNGRLYLQVADSGKAAGWMSNLTAHKTFRLVGRVAAGGDVDLACECPPGQGFSVRGSLHPGAGEARGQLAFSSASGVFGRSQVTLGRQAAR